MKFTKIIVGLGNPGSQYVHTRHNAGFLLLDLLARDLNLAWQINKKNQYLWAEYILPDQKIVLVKPQAFMNQSGKVVKEVLAKFLVSLDNLWVIHDDLDIVLGETKMQFGKGPHVHNGLLSIYEALGSQAFWHLRIGIDGREGLRTMVGSEYVLKPLEQSEQTLMKQSLRALLAEFKNKLTLS